ncbi:hypothetical protein Pla175_09770 [Pirellulimonas nuda]|uniref:Secreted protein n=2 Tax=Pirellulimonas nuda TaxID=2528009 RepID=A0A518D7Z6_9BACT|nr:hypothetical protein Pla175_09770 [Pirellulimonas nuda]
MCVLAAALLVAPAMLAPTYLLRPSEVESETETPAEVVLVGVPRRESARHLCSGGGGHSAGCYTVCIYRDPRGAGRPAPLTPALDGGQHALRNGSGGPLRL